MRQWIYGVYALWAFLGCSKEDPQTLINQWNMEFASQKSACEGGDRAFCLSACRMAAEHSVCTRVSAKADLNDPPQKAWVDKCIADALEQGRSVCPAAGPLLPTAAGQDATAAAAPVPTLADPPVPVPSVTAPSLPYPADNPIADLNSPSGAPPNPATSVTQSAEETSVKGSLPKEVIRRIVRTHIGEVKFCYEKELQKKPDLQGKVKVKLVIGKTGEVQMAKVEDSTLGAPSVENCILEAVRRWTFPEPEGGAVIVTYPFEFKSK